MNDPAAVSCLDELPLWSAPFGMKLLESLELRPGLCALDLGCGTGFPLIEIAQRLGSSARTFGIDPWSSALARTREKLQCAEVKTAALVEGRAECLPFRDQSFDLIVSNNGLNNVGDPAGALRECSRVACPGAQLVVTMNLPETMHEFYTVFERVLNEMKMDDRLGALHAHRDARRKPLQFWRELLIQSAFRIESAEEAAFSLHYLDGTAFLGHSLIRIAFEPAWREVVPAPRQAEVFSRLETRLNEISAAERGLRLTIPFVCFTCRRP